MTSLSLACVAGPRRGKGRGICAKHEKRVRSMREWGGGGVVPLR